jgi:ubiquinone biosynthesis monooxygenase Coq7
MDARFFCACGKMRLMPETRAPPEFLNQSMIDALILGFDRALRTLSGAAASVRPNPAATRPEPALTEAERRHAAGLMRVDHTGEVCAQALYHAQSLTARDPEIRHSLAAAARDEEEHLAWTQQRLAELRSRPSLINPLWYAGSFAIGLAAGVTGDRANLGFVFETERQVEEHLTGHLERLPASDAKSRAIVAAMRDDEARHGASARDAGGIELPLPVRLLMRAAARAMTLTAYYL